MYEFKFSSGNVDGVIETVITEMEFLAQKKDLKLHLVKRRRFAGDHDGC